MTRFLQLLATTHFNNEENRNHDFCLRFDIYGVSGLSIEYQIRGIEFDDSRNYGTWNHHVQKRNMKIRILVIFLLAQVTAHIHADDEVMTVDTKRMTLATAITVAEAAIESCTAMGIQIGVTVVDREGNVQVSLRDTIAAPITVPISQKKAFTSANFNSSTAELAERADSPVGRQSMLLMATGALPIEVGGSLLGAVGVSGAPSGETDEECAQAGVDAVLDDLEMSIDG